MISNMDINIMGIVTFIRAMGILDNERIKDVKDIFKMLSYIVKLSL